MAIFVRVLTTDQKRRLTKTTSICDKTAQRLQRNESTRRPLLNNLEKHVGGRPNQVCQTLLRSRQKQEWLPEARLATQNRQAICNSLFGAMIAGEQKLVVDVT